MSRQAGSPLRRIAWLGLVFHTLLVTAAPFEHHDLICHIKTPQHCSSCTSSPVGSSAQAQPADAAQPLADAGSAIIVHPVSESPLLTARSGGRSPPAA
jgi:hypothetical protein